MQYYIIGPTIINNLYMDGELERKQQLGGAIFSLQGGLLWTEKVGYISNVGKDFNQYYGGWFDKNKVPRNGLKYILPHTQYTNLYYDEDELHDEVSIYGAEEEHLVEELDYITVSDILEIMDSKTKAIYVEISESDPFWDEIAVLRKNSSTKVMWEIRTSSATTENKIPITLKTISKVDYYSINLPEAKSLFKVEDIEDIINRIQAMGVPCYLRMGSKGSMAISSNAYAFVESIKEGIVVDTTGCGNSSTAAAMIGFSEEKSLEDIALMGNISAWYTLQQYGPYEEISGARGYARKRLERDKI